MRFRWSAWPAYGHRLAATLVVDEADSELAAEVEAEGMRCVVAPAVMSGPSEAANLARTVLARAPGANGSTEAMISIVPVEGIPEVSPGDDLAELILGCATLEDHDVVVITQKVVSKAEGRLVAFDPAVPDARRAWCFPRAPGCCASARSSLFPRHGMASLCQRRRGLL